MTEESVVQLIGVTKTYHLGDVPLKAVDGIDMEIAKGETLAVAGPSGSGKSTLLNLIGCMDKPSQGKVLIEGLDTSTMGPDELADLRATKVGMVFQFFNLIPVLTALENIQMPMVYAGIGTGGERRERAMEALQAMGLEDKADRLPSQLSGGERQRVAIARAVINRPAILLADEPTGNLDSQTGRMVLESLQGLSNLGQTTLIATHDQKVLEFAERSLTMRDGRMIS